LVKRDDDGVDEFMAEATFRFKAKNVAMTGEAIRRLMKAAEGVGFRLETAAVKPADEPKKPGGWTGYGPLPTLPKE
jgi:hypothetical protein